MSYLLAHLETLLLVAFGDLTRGGFSTMVDYLSPVYWFFLMLSGAAVIVLRKKFPDAPRPFRVPLFPLLQAEFGIGHAGTGKNLEVARAPGYFEVAKGRMGLVSLASGNNQYEWAGLPKVEIPGRPGMNPLRVTTRYEVDHAAAEQLRAIGKKLGVLSNAAAARKEFNITPGGGTGGTGTAAFSFVDGDKFDISSVGHAGDIKGNLRSIDEAQKMADFVIVAQHNSTSEGSRGTGPSDFVVDFARKAIDAGADIYFGHGWHTFLGIEIYKGKPIVYGMGNFFMGEVLLNRIPAGMASGGVQAPERKIIGINTRIASMAAWARLRLKVAM